MRIGIFGGTFDPIHQGHLRAAEEVRECLELDRILFVPAGHPPHRMAPAVPAADRLSMVRKAVAGNPAFQVSEAEIRRPGKSYTVDTLRQLRSRRPSDALVLILGEDQFREIGSWHQPDRLFEFARIVVITRPGVPRLVLDDVLTAARLARHRKSVDRLAVSCLEISSTDIRERIRSGRSVRYLVPDAVRRHIQRRKLYSKK